MAGQITFWEGNDCSQDKLGSVPYVEAQYDLKGGGPIPNDEARSCTLEDLGPGTIKLFNSPKGSKRDDWTEIKISGQVDVLCIGTFDQPFDNGTVEVIPNGGHLDGKLSRIEVDPK